MNPRSFVPRFTDPDARIAWVAARDAEREAPPVAELVPEIKRVQLSWSDVGRA
jgi:hypothetical protein